MNKLMIRIFSAYENQEDAVLDQIFSDIALTQELGPQQTKQYDTSLDDDGNVLIHDKVNDQVTKAIENGNEILLEDMGNFTIKKSTKNFANTKRRKFLVDKDGSLVAYGWDTNLGKQLADNPELTLVDHYDLKKHCETINAKFSNFSEENQKYFTRTSQRWAVLDEKGNLKGFYDIMISKTLVSKNEGWKMIRRRDYLQEQSDKLACFSAENQKKIIESL